MKPVAYAVQEERSSPKFAAAFAAGCGGTVSVLNELSPGPVAMFGSPERWAILQQAIQEGREWYYGDHAYFRRFAYYRISKNAYQFKGTGQSSMDRLRQMRVEINPAWKTDGSAVVICPNSPVYMAQFGIDAHAWIEGLIHTLHEVTDRPIVVRWKAQAAARPLYIDLNDAWMVVSFSSASAVEALAAGVPVCTLAPWAATADMGIQDIRQVESPIYPDGREQFLANLCANQWTLEEIHKGIAWRALRDA